MQSKNRSFESNEADLDAYEVSGTSPTLEDEGSIPSLRKLDTGDYVTCWIDDDGTTWCRSFRDEPGLEDRYVGFFDNLIDMDICQDCFDRHRPWLTQVKRRLG